MSDEGHYFVATKAIVVRSDGKMITMLRGKGAPTNPLTWDLPGGILEYGEEVEDSIVRETKEEIGLDMKNPRLFHAISRMNDKREFWTTLYYSGSVASDDVVLSFEHDESKWVTPEEYQSMNATTRNKLGVSRYMELRAHGTI